MPFFIRPAEKTFQGAVDEAWVPGAEGFEAEAQLVHSAGAEIFHYDIGLFRQAANGGFSAFGFEVNGEALFVSAVEAEIP